MKNVLPVLLAFAFIGSAATAAEQESLSSLLKARIEKRREERKQEQEKWKKEQEEKLRKAAEEREALKAKAADGQAALKSALTTDLKSQSQAIALYTLIDPDGMQAVNALPLRDRLLKLEELTNKYKAKAAELQKLKDEYLKNPSATLKQKICDLVLAEYDKLEKRQCEFENAARRKFAESLSQALGL